MPTFTEIAVAFCLLLGTFLMIVTAIGLLRLPDVFCRMHAAGKAGTLGLILIILGAMIPFAMTEQTVTFRALLAILFQFITTPAATHLLSRASYVAEYPLHKDTAIDELEHYLPTRPEDVRHG